MFTLTDRLLTEILCKETNPNERIFWQAEDLALVKIVMRALRLTAADDSFLIDAVIPYWLYLAILAALAPKKVLLNTPNFGPIVNPQK